MAKKTAKQGGKTPPIQMRLGEATLAEIDELVKAFVAETGDRETRTSVVRKLVHREFVRRQAKKT